MATILIVDDRPTNRELLVTLLGYAGHRLLEAAEGEEGLVIARAERPDLIITDIVMPTMDGYEFAHQVRADPLINETQIIFYTSSYVVAETRRLAEACGVSIVISKPIEPEELLNTVKAALESSLKPVAPPVSENFHHEHMRILTDTLAKKVEELEAEIAERQRAQEQISYQARLLRHINDSVIATDDQLRITAWNRAAEKMYGWRSEEVMGRNVSEILNSELFDEERAKARERLKESNTSRNEIIYHRKDGRTIYVEANTIALTDQHGKMTGYVSVHRDITERKQAEAELRLSEERFSKAFYVSPAGLTITRIADGKFIDVNDAFLRMFKFSRTEVIGHTSTELNILSPEERAKLIEAQLASGGLRSAELQARSKSGRIVNILFSSKPMELEGEPHHVTTMIDITDRKRAEEALQEKERLLSEAQRIGHIGSWSYDIFKDTLQYSDEMYLLLDVSPRDFQHNREGFLNAIYSSDRPKVTKWMDEMKAGRQVGELDFLIFLRTGELRYIHCRGAVEFDTKGIPAHFTGTAQDITERKLADLQIHQQLEYLNALRRIDQAITSSFNLLPTLEIVLSQVLSQLQVDAADILLLDPEAQMLEYVVGQGFRTQVIETSRVPVGESFAGRAVKERRLIRIENLKDQSDTALLSTLAAGEGFISYFGVPLITKGKVKGVLEVFHRALLQPYPEWVDFLETLAGQAAIAIDNATLFENLQQSNQELMRAYDATIEGWSRAMDLRDKETEGHTQRVTDLTLRLAGAMNMSESELVQIRRGVLLHDMGKLGVPDNILLKPGKLTDEEWEIMRKHPQFAYEMLSSITYLKSALNIPYCHHEKWDGTGYPRGLKGEQIPVEARIFSVVDVWDALTSDRPYRKAWSKGDATQYIRDQSGKHFDPKVVDIFLNAVAKI